MLWGIFFKVSLRFFSSLLFLTFLTGASSQIMQEKNPRFRESGDSDEDDDDHGRR